MNIDHKSVSTTLTDWNTLRLEREDVQDEIKALEARVDCLSDRMIDIKRAIESELFFIEQPYGLRIEDDYVVVIRDEERDQFTIQTVDFNLREEIANDS